MKNKVLVCITPQSNSRRLIDKGAELTKEGELHILHIERGAEVFNTSEATHLLQSLFDYASSVGGIVHGMCSEDVAKTIQRFAVKERIRVIVLGAPDKNYVKSSEDVIQYLMTALPYLDFHILEREQADEAEIRQFNYREQYQS